MKNQFFFSQPTNEGVNIVCSVNPEMVLTSQEVSPGRLMLQLDDLREEYQTVELPNKPGSKTATSKKTEKMDVRSTVILNERDSARFKALFSVDDDGIDFNTIPAEADVVNATLENVN